MHRVLKHVRTVLGLPALAGCGVAAASGLPVPEAPDPIDERVRAWSENPEIRWTAPLDTPVARQAFVRRCMDLNPASPEICDLRTVVPFDHERAATWAADRELTVSRAELRLEQLSVPPAIGPVWRWSFVNSAGESVVPGVWETRPGVISQPANTDVVEFYIALYDISGRPYGDRLPDLEVTPEARPDWVRRAREEYASVASFARHALEMLALAAPPELIAAITSAQQDEIRHARLCLERATAHGGRVQLGTVQTDLPIRTSAFDVAMGVALEGCINETLSAMSLLNQGRQATDADREVLESIGADEVQHAGLAWRTLRWLLPQLTRRERRAIRAAMWAALPREHKVSVGWCVRALAA
jgi:hypothetical protein